MDNIIKLGFRGREATLAELQGEVGPGWSGIIERLVPKLFELGWDGVVLQCKEKFGGMRFYTGQTTSEMEEFILDAENQSYKICELCGAPGVPRKGGWVKTLCDKCGYGREPHPDLP